MEVLPLALTFDDVLLVPQRSSVSSRTQVSLKTKITNTVELNFPLISINMETVTGPAMAQAMDQYGGISFYPRFKSPAQQAKEIKSILAQGARVIPAVGIKDEEVERVRHLVKAGVSTITIDVAHAHLDKCLQFLRKIKKAFPETEIIAGVIATYEGARDLFEAGADAVRVGVGPGTICTTRVMTGSGVPQITAIMAAARAGQEYGRPVLADGGTKNSGDIVKALAAGANAVVVGNQVAGSAECPGEIIEVDGKSYKVYNGSTSKTEKTKQVSQYAQDKAEQYAEYIEGVEALVPYKGPVAGVLRRLETGIRSGLSYSGAHTIAELHQKAQFIRVTTNSVAENGAHGVVLVNND